MVRSKSRKTGPTPRMGPGVVEEDARSKAKAWQRWRNRMLFERIPEHAKHWPAMLVMQFGVLLAAMGLFPELRVYLRDSLPWLHMAVNPAFRALQGAFGLDVTEPGESSESDDSSETVR